MSTTCPLARKDKLVVRELEGELLVYDLARNKALCLNRMAAAVWNLSNGQKRPAQIADQLSREFDATIEEQVVWAAIDQLGHDHLLEYCIPIPANDSGITRRKQLKNMGRAAGIAGPMIAALTVPKASAAQSCRPANASCTPGSIPCCNGNPCMPKDHGHGYTCKG